MTEPCKHRDQYPENVEMPLEASLEHFDQCFTAEGRLTMWEHTRDMALRAMRCRMQDHEGALVLLHECHLEIVQLRRELARKPSRQATRAAYRARARRRTRSHR